MNTIEKTKKLQIPATFIMAFLLGYYIATYQYSLLAIAADFSLDEVQIGVLVGLNYGTHMILPVLFGILADRIGKKPFLILGCIMLAAGILLFLKANNFATMIAITFLAGSGFGAMQSLYLSMLADSYPDNVTRYTNFAQTIFGFGAFLGPLLAAGLIGAGLTWQQSFLPIVLFITAAVVFLAFTHPAKKREAPVSKSGNSSSIFKSPLFYILLLWMISYMGIEMPVASFSNAFFVQQLSVPEFAALALSLYWIMMVPSRLLMGIVKKNHLKIIAVFSVLLIITSALIALIDNYVICLVLFALSGFLCGPIWPTIFASSQKSFPHATGTVGSFCNAFSGLGGFLFPILFGAISNGRPLTVVYFAIAIVAVICLLFALLTRRNMRRIGVE